MAQVVLANNGRIFDLGFAYRGIRISMSIPLKKLSSVGQYPVSDIRHLLFFWLALDSGVGMARCCGSLKISFRRSLTLIICLFSH